MNCLAFDLGANSGKFAVADYDGKTVKMREIYRFDNSAVQVGESLYWNLGAIWSGFLEGAERALVDCPAISSVGIDTFSNDFALISEYGDLMAPVRSYRDTRTLRCEDAIYARMSSEELYGISGNQIAPFNTLMQLAAMCIEGREGLLREAGALLFLPDYFAYLLAGEQRTERTIASVSQMYDHGAKDWSDTVLDRFDIEKRIFAPFIDAGAIAGKIDPYAPGMPGGMGAAHALLVCAVPEHDTAAAFVAAQGGENTLVVSSGTWTIVGCEADRPLITDYGFRYNIANEGGLDGHHRLLRNLMGNWILQECRREALSEGGEWDYGALSEAAAALPAWERPIDVDHPEFYAPGNMREKISELCLKTYGSAPETPAEITASVCAGLALKTRWAMEKLETLTGRRFERIDMIGGGSRDLYAAQLTADATGLPVTMGPAEASLLGNIVFQLIAQREISGVGEGRELIKRSMAFTELEPKAAGVAEDAYIKFCRTFCLQL